MKKNHNGQTAGAGQPEKETPPETESRSEKIRKLFVTFFKIGLFTFGGGYAMIPLIREEIVNRRRWIKDSDLLDITAIAESTPGPIAINSATFVGVRVAGFAGAAAATVGVVLPSFVIIYAISFILKQFENFTAVKYAFAGIRAGVLALIINAMVSMYRQCPKGLLSYILMAAALVAVAFFDVSVLWVIVICAAAGLTAAFVQQKTAGKKGAAGGTADGAEQPEEKTQAAEPEKGRDGE